MHRSGSNILRRLLPCFPHRHVCLPKELARTLPKGKLLTETEWRNAGVQQSRGWVHYACHRCVIAS